jgi:hypothetical protein
VTAQRVRRPNRTFTTLHGPWVREWAAGGNTVQFSFDQLEPLFRLVIAHTSTLAKAYSVALADFQHQGSDGDAGVVVQLRQHLEVQKRILGEAA